MSKTSEVLENEVNDLVARMLELKGKMKTSTKTGTPEEIAAFELVIGAKLEAGEYKDAKAVDADLRKLKVLQSGRSFNYVPGINRGVGNYVYGLMVAGEKNDRAILAKVAAKYGNDNSKMGSIKWYRNKFNKGEYIIKVGV